MTHINKSPLIMNNQAHALTELQVHTASHTYPIIIQDSADRPFDFDFSPFIKGKKVLIVTNDTIARLYLEALKLVLVNICEVDVCILPDGECYKNQHSIDVIYDHLMRGHFGRDSTLIALGGGVIGDMTGFAAASFMRGVNFIQVPTTLLAQVDSSVGGKTGINHPLGKNMIGAFWQPALVFADLATFATLADVEFAAGMAEVIKYALIMDRDFLDWLEANHASIRAKDSHILAQMVRRCCAYKAQIVAQDEKESGRRALLNFGHTFGHVIETHQGYGTWLHGHAVAVGMVQAATLSARMGLINDADVARIVRILLSFDLPITPPPIAVADALSLMGHDKKVKAGKIRLVLLRALGDAFVTDAFEMKFLEQVLGVHLP